MVHPVRRHPSLLHLTTANEPVPVHSQRASLPTMKTSMDYRSSLPRDHVQRNR